MTKLTESQINQNINDAYKQVVLNESESLPKGIIKLNDGLTVEQLKSEYPWVLKAKIKDAVLAWDDVNGLVWEEGTWINGTWEDGWWQSGTWKNGTWNAGTWGTGTWLNGTFEGGKWYGGTWKNGTWKGGIWLNGEWEDGTWVKGTWRNGSWVQGTWKPKKTRKPNPIDRNLVLK